jgi:prophage regulatory protein
MTRRCSLPPSLEDVAMVDMAQVLATFGLRAPSVIYEWVSAGTMPPPIRLSARCSRWRTSDVHAIARARIAGQSDDQVRDLVRALRAPRPEPASSQ